MQRTPEKNQYYGSDSNVARLKDKCPIVEDWINTRQKKKREDVDSDSESCISHESRRQKTYCCSSDAVSKNLATLSAQMEKMTQLLNTMKEEQNTRFYEIKNEISDIKKANEEIEKSVDYLGLKYKELEKDRIDSKEHYQKQENRVKDLFNRNVYLEKCNKALEERIIKLEQKETQLQIELQNVQMQEGENLIATVNKIAQELKLNINDIEKVRRIPGVNTKVPRPIIISLRSREARLQWVKCKKITITNDTIFRNDNHTRIYINEHVTRYTRQLFWITKNKLKEMYKFIWIQNGNVLIKKNEIEKKIIQINFESDIKEILKNEVE